MDCLNLGDKGINYLNYCLTKTLQLKCLDLSLNENKLHEKSVKKIFEPISKIKELKYL